MALTNFSPTVLLVDELGDNDCLIRSWFEASGYHVRESNDIYDALEEATDITLEISPSMILLNSYSPDPSCSWVINSLYEFAEKKDVPIVSLSVSDYEETLVNGGDRFIHLENFELLKPLMRTLLPLQSQMRAVA